MNAPPSELTTNRAVRHSDDVDTPLADVSVVVATKGRPLETVALLHMLQRQSCLPRRVLVVGVSEQDIDGVREMREAADRPFAVEAWCAARAGLTIQRNEAVGWLRSHGHTRSSSLVIFFDDDFRPADDWIEQCVTYFSADPDLVGITGQVLADGIHGAPLSDDEASRVLSGTLPPRPHWASGRQRETSSVYGCNMAFAGRVMDACLFDEALPLYGWQEDRDMTGQAKRFGRVMFEPNCRGVHLGARGARSNGVRLGYSQIANMVYLGLKGTVEWPMAARFLLSSLAANLVRTCFRKVETDHRQRLKGNLVALADLVRGRCDPRRILELS